MRAKRTRPTHSGARSARAGARALLAALAALAGCSGTLTPLTTGSDAGNALGDCTPGDVDCEGTIPWRCTAAGVWEAGPTCFVCVAGACTGECAPGSRGCVDGAAVTCSTGGQWLPGSVCPAEAPCANGFCGGATLTCFPSNWCIEQVVDTLGDCAATAVWAAGTDDVWAARSKSLLHWDGSMWQVRGSLAGDASAIWGAGPSDVWAVGEAGYFPYAYHWDGASWSRSALPGDVQVAGVAVWGAASADVWVVAGVDSGTGSGSGVFLHWDGASWSALAVPADFLPTAISGTGPSDVWVVGRQGTPPTTSGAAWHWDGSGWSGLPCLDLRLNTVWAAAPDDVWASGPDGLYHWDGTAWTAASLQTG